MRINFDEIPVTVTPHMRGGDKEVTAAIYADEQNRIMRGTLIPGASIGAHCHEGSSEIVYVLSGVGTMICDGVSEQLTAGMCHYCPEGHSHTFRNDSDADVTFLAVIPQHKHIN